MDNCEGVPSKRVVLPAVTKKLTGMLSSGIVIHIGKSQTKIFLVSKSRISNKSFDLANWGRMEEAMKLLTLEPKIWVAKFSSRFYVTGKMMKIMGDWKSNLFPCCIEEVETAPHVLQCNHPDMADTSMEDTNDTRRSLDYIDTDSSSSGQY